MPSFPDTRCPNDREGRPSSVIKRRCTASLPPSLSPPPRCQFIRYSHNYPELSGTRPSSPPPYVPKFVFDCHFAFRSSSGPHLINGRRVMLVNARFQFNLCAANFDRGCRCREISGGSGRRKIARNVKFHEGT